MLPTTTLEERFVLVKTTTEEWKEFLFPQIRPILFWCEKSWILTTQKFFVENHQFESDFNHFFSTKVWVCKSENLVLCDHPTKIDVFCAVQHLTSILKFFKLIFQLNLKLRYAVEISDKKILIFEKFEFSTFTEKKNQGFWTRIDQFRNCFRTLAYPDVTWSVPLKAYISYLLHHSLYWVKVEVITRMY